MLQMLQMQAYLRNFPMRKPHYEKMRPQNATRVCVRERERRCNHHLAFNVQAYEA